MNKKLRSLVLCLAALTQLGYAHAQEALYYEITAKAEKSFQADEFAAIDKMANQLRTERRRLTTGNWQLSTLHGGVLQPPPNDATFAEKDVHWSTMENKLKRWIQKYPGSPTAPILLSNVYVLHGFLFRGEGMADTVTSDGWRNFHHYVELSRQTLERYKNISAVDPYWYARMIVTANLQRWPKERVIKLFEEGTAKEPLFHDTYLNYAEYLSPLWGGSLVDLESFADSAVARTKATEGNTMYARIFWGVYDSGLRRGLFKQSTIWSKMKLGFEDLIKRYPDPWNRHGFAKFACMNGDVETVKAFFAGLQTSPEFALGKQLQTEAWPPNYFEKCRDWAMPGRPS